MVALAIRLSDAGVADYWDDVDQMVRNHLVEQQLTDADLLQKVSDEGIVRPPGSQWWTRGERSPRQQTFYPGQEVAENVIKRTLGVYAGRSRPTSIPDTWVMQCCTLNGTQGLYYAWEAAVRSSDGKALRSTCC